MTISAIFNSASDNMNWMNGEKVTVLGIEDTDTGKMYDVRFPDGSYANVYASELSRNGKSFFNGPNEGGRVKTIIAANLIGLLCGTVCGLSLAAMWAVDPIDTVIAAESTYRNITICGEFGEVVIVGDDAEAFLQSEYPVILGETR